MAGYISNIITVLATHSGRGRSHNQNVQLWAPERKRKQTLLDSEKRSDLGVHLGHVTS